jgi:DNA-binding NarL/FixJ family response regulator
MLGMTTGNSSIRLSNDLKSLKSEGEAVINHGRLEPSGDSGTVAQLSLLPGDREVTAGIRDTDQRQFRQKRIAVLLVDGMTLTRECLLHTLSAGAKDFEIRGIARWGDIGDDALRRPDITLLNINGARLGDDWVIEQIKAVRDRLPGVPMIVLSERDDTTAAIQAVHLGLQGYVPSTLSSGMLVAVIRLVLAGGTFVPPSVVQAQLDQIAESRWHGEEDSVTYLGFTPREAQVLEQLQQGKANKVIAYELNISESTVKVHVRNIMKKLHATNRTQVAFLAQRRPK